VSVSHDRTFLQRACTHTLDATGGGGALYAGGYSDYVLARERRQDALGQLRIYQERDALEGQAPDSESDVARAEDPTADRSKQPSRFRLQGKGGAEEAVMLHVAGVSVYAAGVQSEGDDLHAEGAMEASEGNPGAHVLLRDVSLSLSRGECVLVLGRNGAGKTSLLRALAGEAGALADGVRQQSASAHLFHFRQEGADALVGGATAADALWELCGGEAAGVSMERMYRVMKQLGLPRAVQHTPLDQLSGGEKARLCLAHMLLSRATVLVCDEPTNHLDLRARAFLQEALRQFDGAVLLTSHDRFFAAGLATRCLVIGGEGQLLAFEDSVDVRAPGLAGAAHVSGEADSAATASAYAYARSYGLMLRTSAPGDAAVGRPGPKRRRGKAGARTELATVATTSTSEAQLGYSTIASGGYAVGEDGSSFRRAQPADSENGEPEGARTQGRDAARKAAASANSPRRATGASRRSGAGRTKKAKGTPFWKGFKENKKGRRG
jgi:ABC-type multidrug transport system ATPase subunit